MATLLPENATPFEVALAQGMVPAEVIPSSIAAMRQIKFVSPRPSMLPFLVWEYGLGELTPYVPNLYNLIDEGVRWQRLRGTVSAVAIGLAWVGYTATIEPAWTGRAWWNSFQLRFDALPLADVPDLERIEAITRLSVPKRSQMRRGVHSYDVGAVELDETPLDGAMLDSESGIATTPAGTLWSFGRVHEFEHTLTEAEGVALGNWLVPSGGESLFADFANQAYRREAFASTLADLIDVARSTPGMAQNAAGAWVDFAADVARITDKGLLIEPAGTNLIRYSDGQGGTIGGEGTANLPTGWTFTTSGGLTATHLARGGEKGLPYNDIRFQGTATASFLQIAFENVASIPAVFGQIFTISFFAGILAGAADGYYARHLQIRSPSGTQPIDAAISVTGDLQRFSSTRAMTSADCSSLRPAFRATLTAGASYDFTVRLSAPQCEEGTEASSPIITTGAAATRAADAVTLEIPAGEHQLTYSFEDGSQLIAADVPGGDFAIPVNLPRAQIKTLRVIKTDSGEIPWMSLNGLWIDADYLWNDDPVSQRRAILAGWFSGRPTYVRLSDGDGTVIGYRRCRAVHPVAPAFGGAYALAGTAYDPAQAGGILYAEALTQFDDAADVICTTLALMAGGALADGIKPGTLWLEPDDYIGGTAIAVQATTIPLRRTVREQIKILMRF